MAKGTVKASRIGCCSAALPVFTGEGDRERTETERGEGGRIAGVGPVCSGSELGRPRVPSAGDGVTERKEEEGMDGGDGEVEGRDGVRWGRRCAGAREERGDRGKGGRGTGGRKLIHEGQGRDVYNKNEKFLSLKILEMLSAS